MSSFPINDSKLKSLAATRGGRVALGGFEYQRAFALLRLTAMALRQPVTGCAEVPQLLRYEWAEDIDELCADGRVLMWQCKHGTDWHSPAPLADVLLGFAAKWIWTPPDQRHRLAFRLVTSDPAFAAYHDMPGPLPEDSKIAESFTARLSKPQGERSDRALWQSEADALGHSELFVALRNATQVHYMPGPTAADHRTWVAEQQAVDALARTRRLADPGRAPEVIAALRPLLDIQTHHSPAIDGSVARPDLEPRWLRPFEVDHRLHPFSPMPALARLVTVDRTRLSQLLAEHPGPAYVARRPEWRDVVRGADPQVCFLERTQTDDLVQSLAQALPDSLRREGGLRLLPVLGAPGAGKSTLAIRAAAKLVLDGQCLAVDMRHGLDQDEDPSDLIEALLTLASGPMPVLLLLDDPFSAGSGWPQALQKLGRSHPAMVALAPSPDFLYERYKAELRPPIQVLLPLIVDRPNATERFALAALYPEADIRDNAGDEELLVLAMQAAANMSFDEIIEGIWRTLADGKPISIDALGDTLPWPTAAFALVCWFHRAYAACPQPLLQAFLAGRTDVGQGAGERLRTMVQRHGWRIFELKGWEGHTSFAYQGGTAFTMHARVAQRAWELRPAPGWDIADAVVRASVAVPEVALTLGIGLATLQRCDVQGVNSVIVRMAPIWTSEEAKLTVETRNFCHLVMALHVNGVAVPQWQMRELSRRANLAGSDSWLAALQLNYLSSERVVHRHFPSELSLADLIDNGDYSIAPNRASKFATAIAREPAMIDRFKKRLWAAFNGQLQWSLEGFLLTWLLSHEVAAVVIARIDRIRSWLREHPDDTSVRVRFVGLLGELKADERYQAIAELRTWLREHPDDKIVRTSFVGLLGELNKDDRDKAIAELRTWLREHPDDASVRVRFVGLLVELKADERYQAIAELRTWLREHPDDKIVRTSFVGLLGELNKDDRDLAIAELRTWLREHPDDASVRVRFVGLLGKLNEDERDKAIAELRTWLRVHPDDTIVRTRFVGLLGELKENERALAIAELRTWLRVHPDDTNVRTSFVGLLGELNEDERYQAIAELRTWLRVHPDDTNVRTSFVGLLGELNKDERALAIAELRTWLCEHPDDTNVRERLLSTESEQPGILDQIDIENSVDWLENRPENPNIRTSVISVLLSRGDARLAQVLRDTLKMQGMDAQSFGPALVALKACASMPRDRLRLICDWLNWSSEVLDRFRSDRSASVVATAALAPASRVKALFAWKQVASEDVAIAERALAVLDKSLRDWYASVGKAPKSPW